MPKLLATTGHKKYVDGTSATRYECQTTSTLISSMKNIFAPRLMTLTVLVYYAASVAAFEDNWGTPVHKLRPMEQTIDQVTAGCKFDFQPMSSALKDATLNFYPSTEAWASWKGTDLVPENKHLWPGGHNGKHKNHPTKKEISSLVADCEVDNKDGSTWSIQRIGPFKSTGNYDWWQFAWADVLRFKNKLKIHPKGLYILETFMAGVDAQGRALDFPPIHVHHVHVGPGSRAVYRVDGRWCMFDAESCSHPFHVMAEQHGDYACLPEDDGPNCYLETQPAGYGKSLHSVMNINGEMNDVRAPNSPQLEWYFQVAAKWVPVTHFAAKPLKPLSFHFMWGPGRFDVNDQSTMVQTFLTPTAYDNLYWYTGYMPNSGKLLRGKMHTHNTVFEESYLFSGSPAQLGFGSSKFRPKSKAYEVVPTVQTGFRNNEELKAYVLEQYNNSLQSNDKNKPRLICQGKAGTQRLDGYIYDRRNPTHCDEWEFKEGEQFTVVSFNHKTDLPPGPHMPDRVPKYIPGHVGWYIHSEHEGSHESKYTYGFYSQDPEVTFGHTYGEHPWGGLVNSIAILSNKGMPTAVQFSNIVHMLILGAGIVVLSVTATLSYLIRRAKKLN